jgi:eukaryotic-like serine/threonine-protein kinase
VARVGISITHLLADRLLRVEEALTWARHAQTAVDRMSGTSARSLQGRLDAARGTVLMRAGRLDEALLELSRGREHLVQVHGADNPSVAGVDMTTGSVLLELARHDEARALFEQVVARLDAAFGPDHPYMVSALASLASAYAGQGAHEEATRNLQSAIRIAEQTHGTEHPMLGKL